MADPGENECTFHLKSCVRCKMAIAKQKQWIGDKDNNLECTKKPLCTNKFMPVLFIIVKIYNQSLNKEMATVINGIT